jgi:Family of unknown function (DUF6866) N-terminal domain/Family of unknown function (DUF6866) C-terminal domain
MDLEHFIGQVKLNCTISDARSWGFFSICGLLMRLRELYLNEHSLPPWESGPMEEITSWIQERERLWRDLESEELHELVVERVAHDPFDVNGLNTLLKDSGLIYGSGYGVMGKPTFFVARLAQAREIYDYCVYYAGMELCRDLAAYPAMLQGRCIYLRLDVLRTMLWDKFQTLRSGRYRAATEEMFRRFGIGKNDTVSGGFAEGLERMSLGISDLFVLHEVGEAFEDDYWEEWGGVLHGGFDKNTELYLRGIKDLLADTSEMGPLKAAIKEKDDCLLTAYAAFLEGIRKEIFPGFIEAFQSFAGSGDWSLIGNARVAAHEKARRLRADLVGLWKDGKDAEIAAFLRQSVKEGFFDTTR